LVLISATEDSEIKLHSYRYQIFDKGAKTYTQKKTTSSTNGAGETSYLLEENIYQTPISHPIQVMNQRS
jgi:hypothetical protein